MSGEQNLAALLQVAERMVGRPPGGVGGGGGEGI